MTDPAMKLMYEMGWQTAMARAMGLAVKFGPDNDYRLRRALLDAMDDCPALGTQPKPACMCAEEVVDA